jgi:hypothetical protein
LSPANAPSAAASAPTPKPQQRLLHDTAGRFGAWRWWWRWRWWCPVPGRYESPQEILDEFVPVRLDGYERRRAALISTAESEMCRLDNKMRFILGVVKGDIKVRLLPLRRVPRALPERTRADGSGSGRRGAVWCACAVVSFPAPRGLRLGFQSSDVTTSVPVRRSVPVTHAGASASPWTAQGRLLLHRPRNEKPLPHPPRRERLVASGKRPHTLGRARRLKPHGWLDTGPHARAPTWEGPVLSFFTQP